MYGQKQKYWWVMVALTAAPVALPVWAQGNPDCGAVPDAVRLRGVVQSVGKEGVAKNGGMANQEWAAVVNRDGIVCAIVFSGTTRSDEWPASRVIAAEKANTTNALSNRDYALSTANVFAASQPGQSLYSLATSAPPHPLAVFGNPTTFGTANDPRVGKAIGGVIVFAGVLPLYANAGKIVGGLGLSGDTSCTDHVIAWKVRHQLHLDAVPKGPSPDHNDNLILDFKDGVSQSGFGHPSCKGGTQSDSIIQGLSKASRPDQRAGSRFAGHDHDCRVPAQPSSFGPPARIASGHELFYTALGELWVSPCCQIYCQPLAVDFSHGFAGFECGFQAENGPTPSPK